MHNGFYKFTFSGDVIFNFKRIVFRTASDNINYFLRGIEACEVFIFNRILFAFSGRRISFSSNVSKKWFMVLFCFDFLKKEPPGYIIKTNPSKKLFRIALLV
jgi:hypothetical protein